MIVYLFRPLVVRLRHVLSTLKPFPFIVTVVLILSFEKSVTVQCRLKGPVEYRLPLGPSRDGNCSVHKSAAVHLKRKREIKWNGHWMKLVRCSNHLRGIRVKNS